MNFAILTGVLRIAKESIFSGLNNLRVCSILDNAYADVMGFTEEEVTQIAKDTNEEQALPALKKWKA
ncbi:AAA family ATPase [Megasphaera sp.]|uniref:AAA family ATPase n=1 Tax=Megasphaera sp. TaxID=2023260 RepID=UPI003A8C904B|nr:AAA family ATPase [Megasphaera sp.]